MISLKDFAVRLVSFIRNDMGPKVLFYHDVFNETKYYENGTPLELFVSHLNILRNEGWKIVDDVPLNKRECMLTFDDGFRGIWDCRECFYHFDLHPTVFLAVDLIDKPGYLRWGEILELQQQGFIFEAHTWSHRKLTNVSDDELRHELKDAREYLSERLGRNVSRLCFPVGRFNERIVDIARGYGYTLFFSSIYGNADKRIIPDLVCRQLVQESAEPLFHAILMGGANFLWKRYYKMHRITIKGRV